MGTKSNPTPNDSYEKAEDDEPMFVLLARDPFAPALVRFWAELRGLLDANSEKPAEALKCANDMEKWSANNPDHGFKF